MLLRIVTIVLIVFNQVFSSQLYDIDEIRNFVYKIDLSTNVDDLQEAIDSFDFSGLREETIEQYVDKLMKKTDKDEGDSTQYITAEGQRIACRLPNRELKKKEEETLDSYNPKYLAEIVAASFYVKDCLSYNDAGWWAYKMCYKQGIQQTHGAKNEATQVVNSLGMYSGKYSLPDFQKSTRDKLLYFDEIYTGGTRCDLADKSIPRQTTVRYECDPDLESNEAYISDVIEVASCEYIMHIKVGSLCKLAGFQVAPEVDVLQIKCSPVFTRNAIKQFMVEKVINMKKRDERLIVLEQLYQVLMELYSVEVKNKMFNRMVIIRESTKFLEYFVGLNGDLLDINKRITDLTSKFNKLNGDVKSFSLRSADYMEKHIYLEQREEYTEKEDRKGLEKEMIWLYFNDPNWPWNFYPNSLYYIEVSNGYYRNIIKTYEEESKPRPGENRLTEENFEEYLNADPFDPDQNFFVNDRTIRENIYFKHLESYWRRYDHTYFLHLEKADTFYLPFYFDLIEFFHREGFSGSKHDFQQCMETHLVAGHYAYALAVLIEYMEINREIEHLNMKPFDMKNAGYMVERIVSAYYYTFINLKIKEDTHQTIKYLLQNRIFPAHWQKTFQWFHHYFPNMSPDRNGTIAKYQKMVEMFRVRVRKMLKYEVMEARNDLLAASFWNQMHDESKKKRESVKEDLKEKGKQLFMDENGFLRQLLDELDLEGYDLDNIDFDDLNLEDFGL